MPNGPISGEAHRLGVELKMLALAERIEGLEGATLKHFEGSER